MGRVSASQLKIFGGGVASLKDGISFESQKNFLRKKNGLITHDILVY